MLLDKAISFKEFRNTRLVYNISIVFLSLVLKTTVPKPQPAMLIEQSPEVGLIEHEVQYMKKKIARQILNLLKDIGSDIPLQQC